MLIRTEECVTSSKRTSWTVGLCVRNTGLATKTLSEYWNSVTEEKRQLTCRALARQNEGCTRNVSCRFSSCRSLRVTFWVPSTRFASRLPSELLMPTLPTGILTQVQHLQQFCFSEAYVLWRGRARIGSHTSVSCWLSCSPKNKCFWHYALHVRESPSLGASWFLHSFPYYFQCRKKLRMFECPSWAPLVKNVAVLKTPLRKFNFVVLNASNINRCILQSGVKNVSISGNYQFYNKRRSVLDADWFPALSSKNMRTHG